MIDQYSSLGKKIIHKSFWLYLFSFVVAPMTYLIKIIVSGSLSVSEVGILYGVLSLVTLLSVFNDFGMTESLNYFIPKFVVEKKYDMVKTILFYALIVQVITGIITASILYFGCNALADYYFHSESAKPIIKIFSIYFLGINLFQVFSTFFLSIQNTLYYKGCDAIKILFTLIFTIYVVISDLNSISSFAIARVFGLYIGVIIIIYIFVKKYYKVYFKHTKIIIDYSIFKKIISYAFIVFLGTQAAIILSQIDMQMILYILGPKSAGYYTNYLSLLMIPFMLIGPIFSLLLPVFSELCAKQEYKKIFFLKQQLQNKLTIIGGAFCIFLFIFGEHISYVLFGKNFIESGTILQYSILFLIMNFYFQINLNILAGIGKMKERVKIMLLGIIVNIVLNLILIKYIGIYGAALATGISWICIFMMSEWYTEKKIRFHNILPLKTIIVFSLLGVIGYNILNFIPFEGRIYTGLYLMFISIIWFCIIFIFHYNELRIFASIYTGTANK